MKSLIKQYEDGVIGNRQFIRAVCYRAGVRQWAYAGEVFVKYNDVVYIVGKTKDDLIRKGKDIKTYMEFIVELGLVEKEEELGFDDDWG